MANGQAQETGQQVTPPPDPENEKKRSAVRRYVTYAVIYAYLTLSTVVIVSLM